MVENDMYKIVFDLSKGGIIESLVERKKTKNLPNNRVNIL